MFLRKFATSTRRQPENALALYASFSSLAKAVSSSLIPFAPKLMVSRALLPLSMASMITPVPNLAWRIFSPRV